MHSFFGLIIFMFFGFTKTSTLCKNTPKYLIYLYFIIAHFKIKVVIIASTKYQNFSLVIIYIKLPHVCIFIKHV